MDETNSVIEIKASKIVHVIRLISYMLIFILGTVFYTVFFELKIPVIKLAFVKVFTVVMAIMCIVEAVKLIKVKKLNVTISDEYIVWGTAKLTHHVTWTSIRSLVIVNSSSVPTLYEFVMSSTKNGALPLVLKAEDYDLC